MASPRLTSIRLLDSGGQTAEKKGWGMEMRRWDYPRPRISWTLTGQRAVWVVLLLSRSRRVSISLIGYASRLDARNR